MISPLRLLKHSHIPSSANIRSPIPHLLAFLRLNRCLPRAKRKLFRLQTLPRSHLTPPSFLFFHAPFPRPKVSINWVSYRWTNRSARKLSDLHFECLSFKSFKSILLATTASSYNFFPQTGSPSRVYFHVANKLMSQGHSTVRILIYINRSFRRHSYNRLPFPSLGD
jgi:hypothetical protein